MKLNTILAIILILIFLISFIYWFSLTSVGLLVSPSLGLELFIPGALFFGFIGLVSYQLYNCSS